MNQTNQKTSWWGRNWKWVLPTGGCLTVIILLVIFVGAIFFGANNLMKDSMPYKEAISKARQNGQLIELLGEPIEQEGMIQGHINFENGEGDIDIKVPLTGPKGEASLYVVGTKKRDTWTYSDVYVIIDSTGETIFLPENMN